MHFLIYTDKASETRWRLVGDNGETMGDSGEGYEEERDCEEAVLTILSTARTGNIGVSREAPPEAPPD